MSSTLKNMNYIKLFFIALVSSVLFTSCVQVLDIELDPEDSRVVIEGLVTDQPKPFYVKISRTISFTENGLPPVINTATVTIKDNAGNTYPLSLIADGRYETTVPVQGVVGRTYYLEALVDGTLYTAEDILPAVSPIDSMYSIYREIDPQHFEAGYYAYASSTDPQDEENYYLYKFYRNGIEQGDPNEIYFNDDRFLSANIQGVELPGVFEVNDTVKFEQYAITRKAFLFYYGLSSLLNNDGGFFSTPPANAPGNISNGALGLFQASGLASDSIVVQ